MVKVGPSANYYVRARAQAWEQDPAEAPFFDGIYRLDLHMNIGIAFVPDVSHLAPPWSGDLMPAEQIIRTPDQARLYTALVNTYTVTPNQRLAGTDEAFTWLSPDVPEELYGAVFYVTAEEFSDYTADIAALSETIGGLRTFVRVDTLRDHEVIRFVERRIVDSPLLLPRHAARLARPPR
jgi:hypothetical protein